MVDYYYYPILTYFFDAEFSVEKKFGVAPVEIQNNEAGNP